jgi:hypothetical protein
MKKTLILAAFLSAAAALPAVPATAAEMTETGVEAICFVLPGLPKCIEEWRAEAAAHGYSWTPIPNAWWTCVKAEDGSGHLLDCDAE